MAPDRRALVLHAVLLLTYYDKYFIFLILCVQERDEIFHNLMDLELPNRRSTGNLLDVVDKWQNGQITNFEYLTYLNKKAGRTFNDLMQYPVMPFILRDYTSDTIDLRDISVYRDLSKPVSVQDPKNEQKFKMNYEVCMN